LGVAARLSQEGHDVRFWTKDPSFNKDLQGLLSRVDSPRPSIPWCDLAIADMVGFSSFLPVLQKYAKPSLSINPVGDVLELDRLKAQQTAQVMGLDVPESWAGTPPELPPEGLFVKPSGNKSPIQTRCVETPAQLAWVLKELKGEKDVLFQRKVDGIEVSTEGWFNGVDWVKPFNHTFEEKKLMGKSGPGTGCMGNVVVPAQEDKLVKETLIRMTPFLRKAGYRGPLDVNCVVSKDKAHFLEFTARMGYDAVEALITGLREPIGTFLFEVATGVKKEMDLTKDYMMAVRLVSPPYPFSGKAQAGVPVEGLVQENQKYVFPCALQKTKEGWQTTGSDGVVAKITAIGKTVDQAQGRCLRTLGNIKGLDLFYRDDIGERVDRDMKQLKEWGWI